MGQRVAHQAGRSVRWTRTSKYVSVSTVVRSAARD